MFGAILTTTNSSFQKCIACCRSIYVKKVMKLLAFKFNSPRRANNPPQSIHQVTIELGLGKSVALERFKSNFEFRYKNIVSSIKFKKGFAKFMIPIALFKKFLS